jgi:hypothetical protein
MLTTKHPSFLSHYHRQWRRCRLEEVLRKEVEAELQNEGRDDENENETQVQLSLVDETLQQQQQEKLERYRKEQQEQIREDWQEYLRKQARREMLHHHELLADDSVPCAFIEARGAQSTTSSPHQSSQDDCSFEEEETWYSVNDVPALFDVGKVALEVMGFIGDGLNDLLLGPSEENEKPKSKKRKKKKSKSKRECTTTTTTTRETSNFNATEETDFWQQHHLPKLSLLL